MDKVLNLNNELKRLLNANNLYAEKDIRLLDKFNRFGALDIYNKLDGSKEFVFFTKPDLNLYTNNGHILTTEASNNTIINDVNNRFPHILSQLQMSSSSSSGPFMNILSNTLKNTVDLPSITSKVMETSKTIFDSGMIYRKHSFESDNVNDITVEFQDTKNLEVYSLFKVWDEYTRMKSLGLIKPKEEYIDNNILDDQISIYKFIVASDFTTILFYSKLTGGFPTSVPREAFSELQDKLIYSIPFKFTWVEDSDPIIIEEFKRLVGTVSSNDMPLYDIDNNMVNAKWANIPYIEEKENTYYLKWR